MCNNTVPVNNRKNRTHCYYCRRKFDFTTVYLRKTTDHIIPTSKTGKKVKENELDACFECNQWKSDKLPWEWLAIVKKYITRKKKRGYYTNILYGEIIGSLKHLIKELKESGVQISDYKI